MGSCFLVESHDRPLGYRLPRRSRNSREGIYAWWYRACRPLVHEGRMSISKLDVVPGALGTNLIPFGHPKERPMATTTTSLETGWRQEWFEIEDATYLNLAGQSPMPKVSIRAVQGVLEAKKYPHQKPDSTFFEVPNRIRTSIAKLIGGKPDEVALTAGASAGVAAVAYGLTWKPGDEVITAKGEFPLQYTAWKPMEERAGLKLKIVSPRERFITADDLIASLTPRTRMVSVSMVRYDDGSRLDAARVAEACHRQGALLLLDVSPWGG